MRIRHMGIVTEDLERTAGFYEKVFGFKRLGPIRTPGHYPGKAIDLSDGEVNYSLLCPDERVKTSEWTQGTLGPNHIGVEIEDTARRRRSAQGVRHRHLRRGQGAVATAVLQVQGPRRGRDRRRDPRSQLEVLTDKKAQDLVAGANPESGGHRSGHTWLRYFSGCCRIGATAFGGGSATIVAMRQLALRKSWMTEEEFLETVVLSRVTPGITILAQVILIGKRVDGARGAVAA